jgi:hypothetical protein
MDNNYNQCFLKKSNVIIAACGGGEDFLSVRIIFCFVWAAPKQNKK